MVRNPPNCGKLRTALTCTLARGRNHVLRIRSAPCRPRGGRAGPLSGPGTRRLNRMSGCRVGRDALQKPSALHARRPAPPATRATRPHDLRVTPQINSSVPNIATPHGAIRSSVEPLEAPRSHTLSRVRYRARLTRSSMIVRRDCEIILRSLTGGAPATWPAAATWGPFSKGLNNLPKSPELWWRRCHDCYVKKSRVTMTPTLSRSLICRLRVSVTRTRTCYTS